MKEWIHSFDLKIFVFVFNNITIEYLQLIWTTMLIELFFKYLLVYDWTKQESLL